MFDIRQYIPGQIVFKSVYWLDIYNQMHEDQIAIFQCLDVNKIYEAEWLIKRYHIKYDKVTIFSKCPEWVSLKNSEIYRATAMVECLKP